TFTTTGSTSHNTVVTGLADSTSYTYYVRCQDSAGNATTADYVVSFSVGTGTGPLSVSLVSSRTSGVAPLSVFFDASGTTDTAVTSRPFHDLEYRWDFGDPAVGATWAYGARAGASSKNVAMGPVASHVFETPGIYTVALSVFDGTNTDTSETTITVDDPDDVFSGTHTVCVAQNSVPVAGAGGCPLGAAVVQQASFAAAVNTHALAGKRVLFRRGDTFTTPSSALLRNGGPGIVGAYGTGAAPRALADNAGTNFIVLGGSGSDWRIVDLEFDGLNGGAVHGINTDNTFSRLLVLRTTFTHIYNAIVINEFTAYSGIYDDIAIVDSTSSPIINSTDGWRMFIAATRLTIQGNGLGNLASNLGEGSHVVRVTYTEKAVIAHNEIARTTTGHVLLKFHSAAWCDAVLATPTDCAASGYPNGTYPNAPSYNYTTNIHPVGLFANSSGYTEHAVISDNKFVGGDGSVAGANGGNSYGVGLGPQNFFRDERLRDIIFERNWLIAGTATQIQLLARGTDITIRNNIFDDSKALYHRNINVGAENGIYGNGAEPPPLRTQIYNNTFYSTGANDFYGITLWSTPDFTDIANNLAYGPSSPVGSGSRMINNDAGSTHLTQSNNSTDAQLRVAPGWVNATPVAPADFALAGGSYARDAGLSAIPVWSDFFGTSRPQNAETDIGAIEGP
ncbi:MAG: PKD domain-containing protein, partial [Myxococcota bacterium]